MYATRILSEGDRPQLEALLLRHADTSMIIRGNLHEAGVDDHGGRHQGPYAGAFDPAGKLRAVAVQYRIGTLFAAADSEPALDAAARAVVAQSQRRVMGLIGSRPLVRRVRSVLGMEATPVQTDHDEGLYALELAGLQVPPLLAEPGIERRGLRAEDRELLIAWNRAYEIEGLQAEDSAALNAQAERRFAHQLDQGLRCLLVHRGIPCATAAFNAWVPDSVQVGGVYTPPELRSRGYARAVVAGLLLDARERGVSRAILFTGDDNFAAIAAYRALGFERIGDFNITLFR
jgi:predicted GNAT family acetyltransferase